MEYAQEAIYLVVVLFLVRVFIRQKPGGSIDFLNGWMAAEAAVRDISLSGSNRLGL
ncbi:MAG: hypothetical protein ABI606_17135 [Rhodoferax sp.]